MSETKREQDHKPDADCGVDVAPARVISPNGNLVCPDNKGKYDGENAPWRR